jgi:purine-binding chemotaxis protein CheW
LDATPETIRPLAGDLAKLACLESGGQLYGIDVLRVREVVRSAAVTPLPRAPLLIEGLIDLRGVLVPVIDLGRVLRGEPAVDWSRGRIAVVELDGLVFGLRADAATDVLDVDPAQIGPPPDLATRAGYAAVQAVVRRADAPPVLVLSLEHLLDMVNPSELRSQGEEA